MRYSIPERALPLCYRDGGPVRAMVEPQWVSKTAREANGDASSFLGLHGRLLVPWARRQHATGARICRTHAVSIVSGPRYAEKASLKGLKANYADFIKQDDHRPSLVHLDMHLYRIPGGWAQIRQRSLTARNSSICASRGTHSHQRRYWRDVYMTLGARVGDRRKKCMLSCPISSIEKHNPEEIWYAKIACAGHVRLLNDGRSFNGSISSERWIPSVL